MRRDAESRPRVLFVTRKWPPATGGMENYSVELTDRLAGLTDLSVRALPGSDNGMPPPIRSQIRFSLKTVVFLARNAGRYDIVHAGDLVLWPICLAARIRSRKTRILVSAHGTDVAYPLRSGIAPKLYALYLRIGAFMTRGLGVIANSQATAAHCRRAGFRVAAVVPLGVHVGDAVPRIGMPEPYVLFVGRLIERKGCAWFIREVLPKLRSDIRLKVAGTIWDEREEAALQSDRVDFLGPIYAQELERLRRRALVVVVPNIRCGGRDFEGFGLTALEAAADGAVTLAARLDGLVDAVHDGVTGILLEPESAQQWIDKIHEISTWTFEDRRRFTGEAIAHIRAHCTWQHVAEETVRAYSA